MPQIIHVDLSDPDEPEELVTDEQVLSTRQQIAMLAMLSGETQRAAALRAGVREETVSRWMHYDDDFMTLYAMRRKDVRKAFEARIMQLADYALGGLDDLLRGYEYTGSDFYDPRVRLDAVKVALTMAGLLKTSTRVVNIGDKQVNITKGNENDNAYLP